jgi:hypothetical protein
MNSGEDWESDHANGHPARLQMKTQPKLDLYKLNQAEHAATSKPALVKLKPATILHLFLQTRTRLNSDDYYSPVVPIKNHQ